MTTPVTNNSSTPAASSGTGAGSSNTAEAQKGLNSNYQDFLKLLTVQLQNQDPTAPADTNQITQQIASLSQVEQQITINSNLQQLISLFGATQTNNAVSYIGKEVDTPGNQTSLQGGLAPIAYNLPSDVTSATVTIKNAAGQTVFTHDGTTIAGRNEVFWNGKNSTTDKAEKDGVYTYAIAAKDANGKTVLATTYTTGIVNSVDSQNGKTTVSLGNNINVPLSSVLSVRTPSTVATDTPSA